MEIVKLYDAQSLLDVQHSRTTKYGVISQNAHIACTENSNLWGKWE